MISIVRLSTLAMALALFLNTLAGCNDPSPTAVAPDSRSLTPALTEQIPEEELLGGLFSGASPLTPSQAEGWTVTLSHQAGKGCIYKARSPNSCGSGSSSMAVLAGGSTPGKITNIMWGWFNNLDTDNNPCLTGTADTTEAHDLNQNNLRDDGLVELHCINPGTYTVTVSRNGQAFSRTVDHLTTRVGPTTKQIERLGASQATDTFFHVDLGSTVNPSNNALQIDNPRTSAVNDTVAFPSDTVRFESLATTAWSGDARGRLMYRVERDVTQLNLRTAYWNPDLVIRTHVYGGLPRVVNTRAQVATPTDPSDDTNRFSPQRRVVIQQAPVNTVTVSPSQATITTQNGTKTLTATLKDVNGAILTGRTITWSSSNTTVATVSGSGSSATVTGKANGTATITATSEGKSGTSTITVSIGADNAAANGNTFPSSMSSGGIASVTLSMKNTGTTTWTSTAGYQLKLFRNTDFWRPILQSLPSSVAPGGTTTFAFDLRHIEPGVTGTTPAFYKMSKSTFFGAENGRDILVTAPKGGTLAALDAAGPQALSAETVAAWVAGAEDAGTTELPIAPDALLSNGTVVLEYSYVHEASRALDIVFKFTFDPGVLEALRIEPAEGAAGLVIESGLVAPGEYWVRLTGTVPAGQGLIAGLPFRLVPGAKPPRNRSLGTLTVYYP